MPDQTTDIIVGVDTHADTHTAVIIDQARRRLDTIQIPADHAGYESLLKWAREIGVLQCLESREPALTAQA